MFGGKLYVLPALAYALQAFATTVDYKSLKTDKGDGIPDFSFCGYHASNDPLPPSDRQPAAILNATSGDQTQRIQNELNRISAAGGGVLALGAGKYQLSAGLIIPNGTVLRGAGSDKTTLLPKDGSMHVITMGSDDIKDPTSGNSVAITDDYVPVGAANVTVNSASGLREGQDVWVQRQVTQEWIDAMGMGDLVRDGKHQTWLSTSAFVQQPRKIQSISGKVITLDIPLTDTLDSEYMKPELAPYDVPQGPSEMGVEALSMTLAPTCSGVVINDDSCSGAAVSFLSWTVDSYLRDVSLTGFNNVIGISKNARRLTIQNVSITRDHATDNGAGYAADIGISGTQVLVLDSSTKGPQDAKSFPVVTQSLTPGPNAVVRYRAEQVQKGIQPHARWAHGFLVDNSTVTTSFINRGTDGSGHGWAINSGVMWNVDGDYEVQSPPLGTNWGVGCNGDKQSDSNGTFVAQGKTIQPASLFEQQLSNRVEIFSSDAMKPFVRPDQSGVAWHRIGLASEFPDIGEDNKITPSCKTFRIPHTKDQVPVEASIDLPGELKDQVLVFKYKGNFHAIDHQCPHSSFPLSQGSVFDIEDFGITLSTGITCSKHGWSFDIVSGQADRGNYKLKIWEVQLRDHDKEVWVRRKPRIG